MLQIFLSTGHLIDSLNLIRVICQRFEDSKIFFVCVDFKVNLHIFLFYAIYHKFMIILDQIDK